MELSECIKGTRVRFVSHSMCLSIDTFNFTTGTIVDISNSQFRWIGVEWDEDVICSRGGDQGWNLEGAINSNRGYRVPCKCLELEQEPEPVPKSNKSTIFNLRK